MWLLITEKGGSKTAARLYKTSNHLLPEIIFWPGKLVKIAMIVAWRLVTTTGLEYILGGIVALLVVIGLGQSLTIQQLEDVGGYVIPVVGVLIGLWHVFSGSSEIRRVKAEKRRALDDESD